MESLSTAGFDEGGSTSISVSLRVNGQPVEVYLAPWTSLLDFLREQLHLTGTKKGCDQGQCGACTVLMNGIRVNACLILAVCAEGCEVTTVEGLGALDPAGSEALHPVQQAFIDFDALQCGYCTPGQLCSAVGLLNEHPAKSRAEIRERMSGNLCRCGAYPQITDAISRVAFHGTGPTAIEAAAAAMWMSPQDSGEVRG